ncbi:MAG: type II secretion system secretin GspD, partial [Deltaproteobacteria bacterium]|nr:type II secretion system secretin GspD [Deltaproteobacteria bacterium]
MTLRILASMLLAALLLAAAPAVALTIAQDNQNDPNSQNQPAGEKKIHKATTVPSSQPGTSMQSKTKGALRKTVPISPSMKVPPKFSTPPSVAGQKSTGQAKGPGKPGPPTPAPPPPPPGGGKGPPGPPGKPGKTTDLGYGVKEAWELGIEYKKKPKGFKFQLNLEDLDLVELVKHMAKITGKKFVLGNKVKHNIKATIIAPTPVTAGEAYRAFLNVLAINDLTIVPEGTFLKIVDSAGGHAPLAVPLFPDGKKVPGGDQVITRIVHLEHVGADEMSSLLSKFISKGADITPYGTSTLIITDFASNVLRLSKLIAQLDKISTGDQVWVEPVHHASAVDLAEKLQEVLEAAGVSGAGGGGGGKKGKGPQGSIAAAGPMKEGSAHLSKIIPEERTNSLIIVASDTAYLKVIQLLQNLDVAVAGEGEIHVHPLQNADAEELANVLNSLVQGTGKKGGKEGGLHAAELFEGEVKLTHDKATNSLVITASMRDYANLRKVIDKLDIARRQVFVEAVIMEVKLSKIRTLGVSFHGADTFQTGSEESLMMGGTTYPGLSSVFMDPTSLTGLALGLRGPEVSAAEGILGTGISIPAFGVMINALQTNNDVNILSTPNILATDNETAEITIGGNVPVQQGYSGMGLGSMAGMAGLAGQAGAAMGGMGGMGGFNPMFSIGRQNVGLTLKITPHINDSDQIKMEIEIEISEVTGETDLGPLIDQRMAKTVSVVKDQQTVVLGGLVKDVITETVDKVPVLGDIPILGYLFKMKKTRVEKSNLLIFLTPYIIRDASDFRSIFNRKMEERREFIEQFTAFSSAEYEPTIDYGRTNGL